MMVKRVGENGLLRLKKDQSLIYRDDRLEAKVSVTEAPTFLDAWVRIEEVISDRDNSGLKAGNTIIAGGNNLYLDDDHRYVKDDPLRVQATRVKWEGLLGFVHVWVSRKDYGIQKALWSDPEMNPLKSDCLVEDPADGWIFIWWYNSDVE